MIFNSECHQCNLSLNRCPLCNAENISNSRPPIYDYSPCTNRRQFSTGNSSPPNKRRSRTKAQARRSQSEAPTRRLRHKPSLYSENYDHFVADSKLNDVSFANKENILVPSVSCDSKPPQVIKSSAIYGKSERRVSSFKTENYKCSVAKWSIWSILCSSYRLCANCYPRDYQ